MEHGKEYRCPRCAGTDVEGTAWIHLNTGQDVGGDPPDDDYWCPDCEQHIDRVCFVNLEEARCEFHGSPFSECRAEYADGDNAQCEHGLAADRYCYACAHPEKVGAE